MTAAGGLGSVLAADRTTPVSNGTWQLGQLPPEIREWIPSWIPDWVPLLVATVGVFAVAWIVSRILVRLLGRRIARRLGRPSLTRTALRGIRVATYFVAFLVALRINGWGLGNITLSVAVFTAVVGVILAPIVGSIISGVFLLADQPYEIGDMIEIADRETRGFVEDITLRYTKIFTLDNTFLVVPNGTMRDRDVYNYSAEDPRVRQSLDVLVTYESDVEQARDRIEAAARRVEAVIEGGPSIRIGAARYPAAPQCLIREFADSGVSLRLRYWVSEPYRVQAVRSQVQTEVWQVLEGEDVEFAYPHSHLVFDETSGEFAMSPTEGAGWRARPGSQETGPGIDRVGNGEHDGSADPADGQEPSREGEAPTNLDGGDGRTATGSESESTDAEDGSNGSTRR